MAERFVAFSRDRTFQLITPKEFLHIWDVTHDLSEANQDLIREGHWVNFGVNVSDSIPHLTLTTTNDDWALGTGYLQSNPKCVFVDGDRPDVDFAGKLPIIMGFGWIGRTTMKTSATIFPGARLTVDVGDGSTAAGDYGHLRLGTNGEVCVAHAIAAETDWVTFEAVPPYEIVTS